MKKCFKVPTYQSELFSIKSILVEDNTLCIRGNHYDEGVLLGTQYDITGFSFVCRDAETLAYLLNTNVDDLPERIKYLVKGHVDLFESYCRKHGLECNLRYDENELQSHSLPSSFPSM